MMRTTKKTFVWVFRVAASMAVVSTCASGRLARAEEAVRDQDDPAHVHALALEAELDGDVARALTLLRQAVALDPRDALAAFDLARVSYRSNSPELPQDAKAFLALGSYDVESDLLRARLNLHLHHEEEARHDVETALGRAPGDSEALSLSAQLGGVEAGSKSAVQVHARARIGSEIDTNVTVLPDDNASQQTGSRLVASAEVRAGGRSGPYDFSGGLYLGASPHVNNREALHTYDVATGALFGHVGYQRGSMQAGLDLTLTEIFIDTVEEAFARYFMGRRALHGEVWWRGGVSLGAFADAGIRDFSTGNIEGSDTDRDGAQLVGGVAATLRTGSVVWSSRLGYRSDFAEGDARRIRGPLGELRLALARGAFSGRLGVLYEYRDYYLNAVERRIDQRITPSARAQINFLSMYGVFAEYRFVRNITISNFDYSRHLAQLGLEMRWL